MLVQSTRSRPFPCSGELHDRVSYSPGQLQPGEPASCEASASDPRLRPVNLLPARVERPVLRVKGGLRILACGGVLRLADQARRASRWRAKSSSRISPSLA